MAELINDKLKKEIASIFKGLKNPVRIVFFTQEVACDACQRQDELLRVVSGISDKITLEAHDLVKDAQMAHQYGISRVPATAVIGEKDYGIRFYGITAGYEFSSLIEAIIMASRGTSGLSRELEDLLVLIDVPVHLEVMVTLT